MTTTLPASVFTGFVLRDGRRGGFCWDGKPRCIEGHRLKLKTHVPTYDIVQSCEHQVRRDALKCGRLLYVARLTFGGSALVQHQGQRILLVVEVTREHIAEMRSRPMIFLETMQLLSCVLPDVELDLRGGATE